MATTTVGQIGLNMVLNSSSFRNQLNGIQTQANMASQKISNSFNKVAKAAAAAFSAAMIKKLGQDCIELGSNLAEVQNVVDVTFTKMSDKVNSWAKEAASSFGLSETMAKQYAGTLGSMAEAFGFTEDKAYEMSTTIAGLAGDVASFYNLDQDVAYTKLKAIFTGETEGLKDLGVVMTQTALDSYALANGYGKTTSAMSESEKVSLRYKFVLDKLSNAQGDFARTSDGWANQTRVLKLRIDSLKASIGQGLINALTPALKVMNQFIAKAQQMADAFSSAMSSIFGSSTQNGGGTAVTNLTNEATESSNALDNITESAEKAKRSVAGFDKLNILSSADKTKTTVNDSSGTQSNSNNLANSMSGAIDKMANAWNSKGQSVINSIKKSFTSVKDAVKAIGTSWSEVWNNGSGKKMLDNIKSLLTNIFDDIGYIADAFTKAWESGGRGNGVVQSIIDKANSLISLIDTIAEDFGKVWNNGVGERIWGNILDTIRNCNEATATFRDKIKQAWEKNETGKKLWEDILGIVEDITGFFKDMSEIRLEWFEKLNLSPIMIAVENLAGAFRELLSACGDKLKTAYEKILLPLGKWTIEKALPKLIEMFGKALKTVADIIKKINDDTLYAIAGGIAAVVSAIIIFKTGQAIANGISAVTNAIKTLSAVIKADPLLAIAGAITGIVVAVETYNALKWENSEAKKFADEIDVIKEDIEKTGQGIEDSLSSTLSNLTDIYASNTLIDEYQARLDELISKAELTPQEQAELQTIVSYFDKNVSGFDEIWKQYVSISDSGKVELNGDLKDIRDSIDDTIDKYQKLAAESAISDMYADNFKEQIKSRKELAIAEGEYLNEQKKLDDEEDKFKKWLDKKGMSRSSFEELYGTGGIQNDALYSEGVKYYENIMSYKESLSGLADKYNEAVAQENKLIMTGDDLSDIQKVLNGDYTDAAAVLMAYNEQMIDQNDILGATDETGKKLYNSLNDLTKKANESGKNTVLGLVEGTEEYKGALVTNSQGLANTVLSEYDTTMDINSPSKEMYKRGAWTVEGLINGLNSMIDLVRRPIQAMVDNISYKLSPITSVFSGAFGGIWTAIRIPLNNFMSNIERFINGFISALNRMSGGVGNVVNSIGSLFGQEWHMGQLNPITLPRFAKGAIVKAPTLAVVGDNAGANTGNPEVIAPLSKLQSMMQTSSGEDVVILSNILDYLKRIYEMFVAFRNSGGNMYEFVAKLNGSTLFEEMIRQNDMYKRRHNGKSAF